jgi:hypothetical protein
VARVSETEQMLTAPLARLCMSVLIPIVRFVQVGPGSGICSANNATT